MTYVWQESVVSVGGYVDRSCLKHILFPIYNERKQLDRAT